MTYKSFRNEHNKIYKTWNKTEDNKNDIDTNIKKISIIINPTSFIKKIIKIPIVQSFDLSSEIIPEGGGGDILLCWVASEIFGGMYTQNTINVRYYMTNLAPIWLLNFYIEHGKKISCFIKNKNILKIILRPIFIYFSWRGKNANGI